MPSPSSRHAEWVAHILDQIDRIHSHLGGADGINRVEDMLVMDAVERCLTRISEAVSRLHRAGVDLAALEPGVRWHAIRNFGNWMRHEYDDVDEDVVTESVRRLPDLQAAAIRLHAHLSA